MHTAPPQIPPAPTESQWSRYGNQLGSLYRLEPELPEDFCALAEQIAARCAACASIDEEIDDLIIL